MEKFFIGWHQPVVGYSGCNRFPHTMISVNRLIRRRRPFPVNKWILDSGAFTRIASGKGHLPVEQYAAEINRWKNNGKLLAAVSQDWMCESFILGITGYSVGLHQEFTISNYQRLKPLTDVYVMPVLQGYQPREYVDHVRAYGSLLHHGQWVGVGSVCKRNSNPASVRDVLLAIKTERPDLKLHGFGLKKTALEDSIIWDLLHSADSQASTLSQGRGSNKYVGANDPQTALDYAESIQRPGQFSIFS